MKDLSILHRKRGLFTTMLVAIVTLSCVFTYAGMINDDVDAEGEIANSVSSTPLEITSSSSELQSGNYMLTGDVILNDGLEIVVPEGSTVTIDLAGFTLKGSKTGSGNDYAHGIIVNNGTLELKNGTLKRTAGDYYTLINYGTITMANLTMVETDGVVDSASLIENLGTMTIESGTYETKGCNVIKNEPSATKLTINGGSLICSYVSYSAGIVMAYSNVEINGGEFTVKTHRNYLIWNDYLSGHEPEIVINGGTFNAIGRTSTSAPSVQYAINTGAQGDTTIVAGRFNFSLIGNSMLGDSSVVIVTAEESSKWDCEIVVYEGLAEWISSDRIFGGVISNGGSNERYFTSEGRFLSQIASTSKSDHYDYLIYKTPTVAKDCPLKSGYVYRMFLADSVSIDNITVKSSVTGYDVVTDKIAEVPGVMVKGYRYIVGPAQADAVAQITDLNGNHVAYAGSISDGIKLAEGSGHGTVVMLKDYQCTYISSGSCTLDLNGMTITTTGTQSITLYSNDHFIVKDGVGGGKFVSTDTNSVAIKVNGSNGVLDLQGGTLVGNILVTQSYKDTESAIRFSGGTLSPCEGSESLRLTLNSDYYGLMVLYAEGIPAQDFVVTTEVGTEPSVEDITTTELPEGFAVGKDYTSIITVDSAPFMVTQADGTFKSYCKDSYDVFNEENGITEDGDILVLLKDIGEGTIFDDEDTITPYPYFNVNFTIDLNGHSVTGKNGYGTIGLYHDNLKVTVIDSAGKANVNSNHSNGHVIYLRNHEGAVLTIEGGIWNGTTSYAMGVNDTLVIKGGTFAFDPTAYVPKGQGYLISTNDDGTYSVYNPDNLRNSTEGIGFTALQSVDKADPVEFGDLPYIPVEVTDGKVAFQDGIMFAHTNDEGNVAAWLGVRMTGLSADDTYHLLYGGSVIDTDPMDIWMSQKEESRTFTLVNVSDLTRFVFEVDTSAVDVATSIGAPTSAEALQSVDKNTVESERVSELPMTVLNGALNGTQVRLATESMKEGSSETSLMPLHKNDEGNLGGWVGARIGLENGTYDLYRLIQDDITGSMVNSKKYEGVTISDGTVDLWVKAGEDVIWMFRDDSGKVTLVQVTATDIEATHKVIWMSEGVVLYSEYTTDVNPVYTGNTPTKASTSSYRYSFSGWDAGVLNESDGSVTYTAQFTATARPSYTPSTPTPTPTPDPEPEVDPEQSGTTENPDGTTTETVVTKPVTNADGSQTVTTTVTDKDQDGNVTGSTESSTTTNTTTDKDTGIITETQETVTTTKDQDGNVTGSVEMSSTVTKDGSGNVTGSTVTETKSETKVDSETGAVTESTTEKVTVIGSDGTKTVTERTESVTDHTDDEDTQTVTTERTERDETGKVTGSTTQVATTTDGMVITVESNVEEDSEGNVTEKVDTITVTITYGDVESNVESKTDASGNSIIVSETTVPVDDGRITDTDLDHAIEQSKVVDRKNGELGISATNTIVLDVSVSDSNTLDISVDVLNTIGDAGAEVTVRTTEGSVRMSSDVMTNVSKDTSTVTLVINTHHHSEFEGDRHDILQDRHIVSFTLMRDGAPLHNLGGQITASIPYAPGEGQDHSDLRMYYLDDDNKSHLMKSYYDAVMGQMVMDSDHFSHYYVGELSKEGNGTGYVEPADNTLLYAGIAVAIIAIAAVAVILMRRRA